MSPHPTVALIAHDQKKDALCEFAARHRDVFAKCALVATRTTAQRVAEAAGLDVRCYLSGPHGGDVQIAARAAVGEVAVVICLVDRRHLMSATCTPFCKMLLKA